MQNGSKYDIGFKKIDFNINKLDSKKYEGCTFSECIFQQCNLSNIVFTDCRFVDCDLSLATLTEAAFHEVEFCTCKLLGLHFDQCNDFIFSVKFKDCVLNLSSFYEVKMKKTLFSNCTLHETDFESTILTEAIFHECDLTGAVFENTNLEKADFRSAYNFTINPETNRITNAKFSLHGLPGLLAHHKIVIE